MRLRLIAEPPIISSTQARVRTSRQPCSAARRGRCSEAWTVAPPMNTSVATIAQRITGSAAAPLRYWPSPFIPTVASAAAAIHSREASDRLCVVARQQPQAREADGAEGGQGEEIEAVRHFSAPIVLICRFRYPVPISERNRPRKPK